jgi:hypothetical protein
MQRIGGGASARRSSSFMSRDQEIRGRTQKRRDNGLNGPAKQRTVPLSMN